MSDIKNSIEIALKNSFSYDSFLEKMKDLVSAKKSSGNTQSDALTNFTKLNQSRMKRLTKTQKVDDATLKSLAQLQNKLTFIVLTESWCGDAAQTVPVIHKVAENSENIDLKIVYRDDNPELMNHFLTNGGAAIPKLIVLDEQKNVLTDWGPRPTTATKMVNDYKDEHGGLDAQFKEDLQIWYNKNKGLDTLNDLNKIITTISKQELV